MEAEGGGGGWKEGDAGKFPSRKLWPGGFRRHLHRHLLKSPLNTPTISTWRHNPNPCRSEGESHRMPKEKNQSRAHQKIFLTQSRSFSQGFFIFFMCRCFHCENKTKQKITMHFKNEERHFGKPQELAGGHSWRRVATSGLSVTAVLLRATKLPRAPAILLRPRHLGTAPALGRQTDRGCVCGLH